MRVIHSRRSWTKSSAGGTALNTPVDLLFVHHTAGPMPVGGKNATRRVEQKLIASTREFHINGRGMSDIAYNYGVMPSGRAYELRGVRTGGHTYGYNSSSLAIVGFGNYEAVKPTEAMVDAYGAVGRKLKQRRRISKFFNLQGHTEVGAQGGGTACPGKFLMARKGEMKRAMLR